MAKTTKLTLSKLREEELQEVETETVAQPVPATDEEVEQAVAEVAQPELAEPATEETVEVDTTVEDPMFTPPAEGYVPAGWVKIEDLAAAVAQATGDVVPAEISPDVQASNEENAVPTVPAEVVEEQPLVQEEEVITESVENPAEEAVAEDESNDLVSGDLPEEAKITEAEETCPKCGEKECKCEELKEECEECEECEELEEECKIEEAKKSNEICFGTALAKKKNTLNKMTSKEELADFVEETCRPVANDKEQTDYLDKLIKDIKKEPFAKALMHVYNIILKGEGQGVLKESEEFVEDEIEEPVVEEEVFEVEEEDEEVNPATLAAVDDIIDDKNVDFIDHLSDFLSDLQDDVEDAKAESDAILDDIEHAADTLQSSSEFLRGILDDDDDEYGVDLSEFDLDTDFDEEETFQDGDFEDEEFEEVDLEAYKANPDKFAHNPLKGIVDALLAKAPVEEEELEEKIIYPAGSQPETEDLYTAYAESAAAKRKAIANFREAIKSNRSSKRFDEALRGYGTATSTNEDSDAWENNKFEEKYAERQKLSFKELLEKGFLG